MTRRLPGPRPQPSELALLRGNPGKRAIPKPVPVAKPSTTPPVPVTLDSPGRAAWDLYWRYGSAWLAYTDIPMVTRLCEMVDDATAMRATIREEGLMHRNPRTKRSAAHFGLSQLLGVYKAIADLESAAGFTPTDRSRLKVDAPDEGDALEQHLARRS